MPLIEEVLSALQHHSPGTPKGREGCLGTSIRIPAGFVGSSRGGKEGSSALDHLQPDPVVLPLPGGDTWLQTYPRDTLSISGSADSLGVMLQPFSEGFPSAQGPGQDHISFHHLLRHEEIPRQSPQAQPVFNVGKPHRRLNPAPSPTLPGMCHLLPPQLAEPCLMLQPSTSGHTAEDPAWPFPGAGMGWLCRVLAEVSPDSLDSPSVLE